MQEERYATATTSDAASLCGQLDFEQVRTLYALTESESRQLAALFAIPEFRQMPKEWVNEASAHIYTHNMPLPLTREHIMQLYSLRVLSGDHQETLVCNFLDDNRDLARCACRMIEESLDGAAVGPTRHLALTLHRDTSDDKLWLFYKGVADTNITTTTAAAAVIVAAVH